MQKKNHVKKINIYVLIKFFLIKYKKFKNVPMLEIHLKYL